jgi:hypothetical protein
MTRYTRRLTFLCECSSSAWVRGFVKMGLIVICGTISEHADRRMRIHTLPISRTLSYPHDLSLLREGFHLCDQGYIRSSQISGSAGPARLREIRPSRRNIHLLLVNGIRQVKMNPELRTSNQPFRVAHHIMTTEWYIEEWCRDNDDVVLEFHMSRITH